MVEGLGGVVHGDPVILPWPPVSSGSLWALQFTDGGSAPQPLRAGTLRSPKGLMVGLSAWGPTWRVHRISLGAWESGLSSRAIKKLRFSGVYSKLWSQPLSLYVWGPLFLIHIPCSPIPLTVSSVCLLILVELIKRAEPCG